MSESLIEFKPHDHALIDANNKEKEHEVANDEHDTGWNLNAGKAYWNV